MPTLKDLRTLLADREALTKAAQAANGPDSQSKLASGTQALIDMLPTRKLTETEKALAKASGKAKALAGAILALCAKEAPSAVTCSAWNTLAKLGDASEVGTLVQRVMDDLETAWLAAGEDAADLYGADATLKGARYVKGKTKAPKGAQVNARALRDAWASLGATPALANPARTADAIKTPAKAAKAA